MDKETKRSAVIIGGGLVGCAAALHLAQLGFNVRVYERRKDPRTMNTRERFNGRSMSLSASVRAMHAFDAIGVGDAVRSLH